MSECSRESLLGIVDVILREDLTSLARGYSIGERIEFWNMIKEKFHYYIKNCAIKFDREIDRLIRGKFRLAQLMLAASFKVNNENQPEITSMFSDQEYEVLFDLEDLKEIDFLSIDDLVEFIERREGKVYEIVKKYYERGYHMLDTKWTNMMGPLALAMAEKYKERRLKIEEAVIRYIRRRPLTVFMSEIEEAIRKAMEASQARKEASIIIQRLNEQLERIEPSLSLAGSLEEAIESREGALSLINNLLRELEITKEKLAAKERELEILKASYTSDSRAKEVIEAELEALRGRVRELEELLGEYRSAVNILRAEKEALQEKLEELKRGLEGLSEGNLVSRDEAWALENSLVERITGKLTGGSLVYNPLRGESSEVKWSKIVYYSLHGSGRPQGRGVQLQSLKGVLRKRKEVVVDVVTIVHKESYDEKGWDDKPATLGEIMDVLESRLEEAGSGNYYHILVIGSPTGFTEKARRFIEASDSTVNFASKRVTVYLVDPVKGQLYYNKTDEAAVANKHIADPRLPEERIQKVLNYLYSEEAKERAVARSYKTPFLLVSDIREATGEEAEIIARALARAAEKGLGRIMVTENGYKAFFYHNL